MDPASVRYGGFDENTKSFYNMEAPDVVTLANGSEVIQRYLLTESDEILTERTLPTLAFLLTRNAEKADGCKKVKIDIEFIAVGLISIPDEKELLSLMEEIRNEKIA